MLVVHPASLCDVCLDPYIISSEPANSPHVIACGHIFCLTCLRNLSPNACPLCRKAFQPDRVKKLHVAGPPELDGPAEDTIEEEAAQLLQRVALVSGEDVPDVEIIEVVTAVEEWFSNNNTDDDDSHRPLRTALASLQRYKALQERNEREHAEFRRVRRELKAYRRSAHQDSKMSRAVEESLLTRIDDIQDRHAQELSRLHAEIGSLRGEPQQLSRNTSNPLPPPPEPLPLDRFPLFARTGGGVTDISDPLLTAVPYPPPPPRAQSKTTPITNGCPPVASLAGMSHTQYVPTAPITQPIAAPRARHAEVPRVEERSGISLVRDPNIINHPQEERRPVSTRNGAAERYASTDGRSQPTGPLPRRVAIAPSPAPSWAHHPLVEGGRSDEEREVEGVRTRVRTNGANGVIDGSSDLDPRPTVDARLASAEAYIQGYGSGYNSGFHITSEPSNYASSSYGSDRSDWVHGFPVHESSPDQPIGGLGLMGVPQPVTPGTVSTPDEEATPVNRAIRLTRRNTTQAVDMERSARRLGDQPLLDVPLNGGARRGPMQTIDQVLGVRRTMTEGTPRHGVNGSDDASRRRRISNGVVMPLAGENESPRSETTWGTVQTLSRDSIGGGSMDSLGLLIGLHNGGVRGQGSVAESYIGREDAGNNTTSEEGENSEMETPVMPGSLPGSGSDASSLGLIREDEGDYASLRNGHALEPTTPRHRSVSYPEGNLQALEATQERQMRRARRSEGTGEHRRHASHTTTTTEALQADSRRVINAPDIIGTNALSLHFDASFPAHDYQGHTFSAPSGPEIFAPTPIVGGPNIIQLWANRA